MSTGLSEKIRQLARIRYVDPSIRAGEHKISIRVRDILDDMNAEGLPGTGHTPQICSALQTGKFLRENGLEISKVEGPPSGQSPTVVIHYRIAHRNAGARRGASQQQEEGRLVEKAETPEEWAHRMTGKICGLLKDEITAMGGTEAFIRWVRSEDEEDASEDAA